MKMIYERFELYALYVPINCCKVARIAYQNQFLDVARDTIDM